jgi:hypothetical protein
MMARTFGFGRDWRDSVSSAVLSRSFLERFKRSGESAPAAKQPTRPGGQRRRNVLAFEPLEPRILLSADVIPGVKPADYPGNPLIGDGILGDLSTGMASVEQHVIDAKLPEIVADLQVDLPGLLDRTPADPNNFKAPNLGKLLDIDAVLTGAGFSLTSGDPAKHIVDANGNNKIDLQDLLDQNVNGVIKSHASSLSGGTNSTEAGTALATALDGISKSFGPFNLEVSQTSFQFTSTGSGTGHFDFGLVIDLSRTDHFSLDLGRNADGELIQYGADDTSATLPDVGVKSFYEVTLTLGLDATITASGANDSKVDTTGGFYLKSGATLSAGATVDNQTLTDFDLRFGFLDLAAKGGTYDLTATVSDVFTANGGGDKIAETNVTGGTFTTTKTSVGEVDITLPVEVKAISGSNFTDPFDSLDLKITLSSDAVLTDTTLEHTAADPRTALPISFSSDFATLEPFRHVSASDVISVLRQIEASFGTLESLPSKPDGSGTSPLFGAEVPFVKNLTLADMLPFDNALGQEINLLLANVSTGEAKFASVQGLVGQLVSVLPDPTGTPTQIDVIAPNYDPVSHILKFGMAFGAEAKVADLGPQDFDFSLNLSPLTNVSLHGHFGFDSLLNLAFTAGIQLDSKPQDASIVTAFAPFGLISLIPASGTNPLTDGKLANDVKFRLDFGSNRVDVTVTAASTATNSNANDLAADIDQAIKDAMAALKTKLTTVTNPHPILPEFQVGAIDGTSITNARLQIVSLDAAFLEITKITTDANGNPISNPDFDKLGFNDGQQANNAVLPLNGILSGAATFDITVNGLTKSITVDKAVTLDNTTTSALVGDIQDKLDAAFGPDKVKVEYIDFKTGGSVQFGGNLKFSPDGTTSSIDFIAINNVNSIAVDELGLSNLRVGSDILLVGDHSIDVDLSAVSLPANGQLAADMTFDVTLTRNGADTLLSFTVSKTSTTDNNSLNKLIEDINAAMKTVDVSAEKTTLDHIVTANLVGGKLHVQTASYLPYDKVTVKVNGATTASDEVDGPHFDGKVTNANFKLELVEQDGTVVSHTFTNFSNAGTSIGSIVAALNAEINQPTSDLKGKVVAGLVDAARIAFAVVPDGDVQTTNDAKILRIVGSDTAAHQQLGFNNIATRIAGTLDAFVSNIDLSAKLAAETLVGGASGTADFGYVGLTLGNVDIKLDGTASIKHAAPLDLNGLADAGKALDKLQDKDVVGFGAPAAKVGINFATDFTVTGSATATPGSISVAGDTSSGVLKDLQTALTTDTPTLKITVGSAEADGRNRYSRSQWDRGSREVRFRRRQADPRSGRDPRRQPGRDRVPERAAAHHQLAARTGDGNRQRLRCIDQRHRG